MYLISLIEEKDERKIKIADEYSITYSSKLNNKFHWKKNQTKKNTRDMNEETKIEINKLFQ